MLAVFMPRQNMVPSFAYVLPAPEVVGSDGQLEPPGMYVVPLPYADDIREPPAKHCNENMLQGESFTYVIQSPAAQNFTFVLVSSHR